MCLGMPLVTNVSNLLETGFIIVKVLPSGRYLRLPADGLLLLLRDGAALGLLLPDGGHWLGLWGGEVL